MTNGEGPSSKIDASSPYYLGPQDRPGDSITPIRLTLYNFDDWVHDLPKQQHGNHAHEHDDNKDEDNNVDLQYCIDDLNDTLLELIFTRLVQWRHLVTCKCVSKRWNSIISNPYFFQYITNKYSAFTLILRKGWANNCLITEHPYFQTQRLVLHDIIPYKIVANHDDILVLNCTPDKTNELAYNIVNPLTKQFIIVRVTCDEPNHRQYYTYDQCKVGFAGFVNGVSTIDVPNSKNNSMGFRIIRIIPYPNKLIWQIYSSISGKWKTRSAKNLGFEFKSHNMYYRLDQAVTLNNRIHWRGLSNKILVIDLFAKCYALYCVLNLPSEIQEDSILGSYRNRLRIAQFESNEVAPRIKVWEFDDYADDMINHWAGNTMAKLRLVINFALKPNLIDTVFPPAQGLLSSNLRCKNEVICCHPNDPDIVYLIFNDKLLQCNVVKNRFRVIRHCTANWSDRFMLVHPLTAP